MTSVGAWPYQGKASRAFALFIFFIVGGSELYFEIAFVVLTGGTILVIVECATAIFIKFIGLIKVFNCLLKIKELRALLEQMASNNGCLLNSSESLIMQDYTEKGRKITIIWSSYVAMAVLTCIGLPVVPAILATGENATRRLPNPVYCHMDITDYYYPVLTHQVLASWFFCMGIAAADTIFVVCVQHACGMFTVLGYKVRNAIEEKDENVDMNIIKTNDLTYRNLIGCIDHHNKAIKFTELIESTHNKAFLFTVGINMVIVSVTGVRLITVSSETETPVILRQITTLIGVTTHLFIENYYGQQLLDHSIIAYAEILQCNWYRSSFRTKKLLNLFIMKSFIPSVVTIGGRYVMCMENFSEVLRLSASYFTILRSVQ
nr:olfactory receptor 59 [Gregopimpla kuwanae]